MNRIVLVVNGLIKKDDKYLFTDRLLQDRRDRGVVKEDFWQLPGGELEFGETPEQACIREVKEETGLDVEIISFVPQICYDIRLQYKWQGIILAYLCIMKDPNQQIVLEAESTKYKWLPVEEIKKIYTFRGTLSLVESAERI